MVSVLWDKKPSRRILAQSKGKEDRGSAEPRTKSAEKYVGSDEWYENQCENWYYRSRREMPDDLQMKALT